MKNPYTGDDLSRAAAKHVERLRTVRRNARKAARSGNPAVRYPALAALEQVPGLIDEVYRSGFAR